MSAYQFESVVLVHGLAGSRLDMLRLALNLKRTGFTVENWGYWSLKTSIQDHADRLAEKVEALEQSPSVEKDSSGGAQHGRNHYPHDVGERPPRSPV